MLFIASSNGNTATAVGQGTNAFITDSSASAPLNLTVNGDAAGTQYMITGSNAYRGVTTLTSGTLAVSVLANGGSNSSIGASTNAVGNLVFGGGTLRYTNTAISGGNSLINLTNSTTPTTDRNFTINNGSSGTIEVTSLGTVLTWSGGSADTNGVLNKTGTGQLNLTGANQHIGGTNVNAGTLLVNGSLSTGAVSVANLATLGGIRNHWRNRDARLWRHHRTRRFQRELWRRLINGWWFDPRQWIDYQFRIRQRQ